MGPAFKGHMASVQPGLSAVMDCMQWVMGSENAEPFNRLDTLGVNILHFKDTACRYLGF